MGNVVHMPASHEASQCAFHAIGERLMLGIDPSSCSKASTAYKSMSTRADVLPMLQAQQLLDQPDAAALRDKVVVEAVARTLGALLHLVHCSHHDALGHIGLAGVSDPF
jgi:hypothetical protein